MLTLAHVDSKPDVRIFGHLLSTCEDHRQRGEKATVKNDYHNEMNSAL